MNSVMHVFLRSGTRLEVHAPAIPLGIKFDDS